MSRLPCPISVLAVAVTALLLGACGDTASLARGAQTARSGNATGDGLAATPWAPGATATTRPSADPSTGGPGGSLDPNSSGGGHSSSPPENRPTAPSTVMPSSRDDSCPDPRYCAVYAINGHWTPDSSGHVILHYRVNATNPPPSQTTLTARQIQQAIDAAAAAWMAADPRVVFIDDGTTTAQPSFNSVIGFSIGPDPIEGGNADILTTCNTCTTYSSWDIKFPVQGSYTWLPCDPAHGNPCTSYASDPKAAGDVENVATHELGHVLGLGHPAGDRPVVGELTMYGGAPDSCGTLVGCRAQDTLGLGDVLGLRSLYPTSAPMPTLYDQ